MNRRREQIGLVPNAVTPFGVSGIGLNGDIVCIPWSEVTEIIYGDEFKRDFHESVDHMISIIADRPTSLPGSKSKQDGISLLEIRNLRQMVK